MLAELSHKRERSWLWQAVFALDRRLRRRHGIYEFCNRNDCLFRVQRERADRGIVLSDGACARPGDPVLTLHFWNEHMPPMGRRGPTVGWARHVSRALDGSMCELAQYLARRADPDGHQSHRAAQRPVAALSPAYLPVTRRARGLYRGDTHHGRRRRGVGGVGGVGGAGPRH